MNSCKKLRRGFNSKQKVQTPHFIQRGQLVHAFCNHLESIDIRLFETAQGCPLRCFYQKLPENFLLGLSMVRQSARAAFCKHETHCFTNPEVWLGYLLLRLRVGMRSFSVQLLVVTCSFVVTFRFEAANRVWGLSEQQVRVLCVEGIKYLRSARKVQSGQNRRFFVVCTYQYARSCVQCAKTRVCYH